MMKDSHILRLARKKIESGVEGYICHAIGKSRGSIDQKAKLCNWVQHMLKGHSTYGSWLLQYHRKAWLKMSYQDMIRGRLQWLDWMIAQCEAKEKADETTKA